ncbi:MAG: NAD(P)-dependent alcohol dehydrogenase [Woeseiaceae bacterium]|nr:NAD(P)-dependent alcohol dehydrogenase [Woeseiaceae bacterium]
MKLRNKIAIGFLLFLLLITTVLAIVISYDSACEPSAAVPDGAETMKAIVHSCYGSPDVLRFEDIEKPTPADDQVLVKVAAAAVNPLDWHFMRGTPYFVRLLTGLGAPDNLGVGVDFAGTVEAVGARVTRFKPGDEVFGGETGAFAEYVSVHESGALVLKPADVSFEEAASMPIAAATALQALRDLGKVEPGQKVLINGASGGVGTFAVQIAKVLGAEVTGVCSTRNVELVRSLGADHVFDYTKENYTDSAEQFDLIIDMVGNHSLLANRRVLKPDGTFIIVGGSNGDWFGPMMRPINATLLSPFVDQEFVMILADMNPDDLTTLGELMQTGKVTAVIDSHFSLREVPAAIRHSEEGHARGKIIIDVE